MNEIEILKRSIRDFFSSSMLKIALVPLIVTMIILYALFFGFASFGIDALKIVAETSQNGGEVIIDENAPFYFVWLTYLVVFLFKYSITSWLAGFLLYTVGVVFIFHLSVILTLIIIGFLTPFVVNYLKKTHYNSLNLNPYGTILGAFFFLTKSLLIMILLYILLVPLYFIPLVNLIALYLLLYYFFHKLLSNEEYKIIYSKNSNSFRIRTFFLYFISTVPFFTLFIAIFYVIYLSHAYFMELEKIQKVEINTNEKDNNLSQIDYKESL